jgi:FixJ family two-component response regulator
MREADHGSGRWRGSEVTETSLIAVVDDDASFREALAELLLLAGFEVEAFESGEAVLGSSRLGAFDVFLLDVQMPGRGGLEVMGELRAGGVAAPVVFVTSHDDPRTRELALARGALAVFGKPVDSDRLMGLLREAAR